ncbi:MAG: gliding motility-associated C-terminal domain-containing protein [Bacteroidia bacterium]|nr:gliding motility-associated C-terminal domain-containing protein [Bacteroidia bacterium]
MNNLRLKINSRLAKYLFLSLYALFISFFSNAQFIENKGQYDQKILYTKAVFSGNILITENGITYLFYDNNKLEELFEKYHQIKKNVNFQKLFKQHENKLNFKYHSIEQLFVGGNINRKNIVCCDEQTYKTNFFLGNDKSRWAKNARAFNKILVKNIYPDIDLEMISNGIEYKYNFICKPGSNPSLIQIKYKGAYSIQLTSKSLIFKTSVITYSEHLPENYIIKTNGTSINIDIKLKIKNDILSFDNLPEIPKNSTLIIDPKLIFSTYSGSTADNFGFTATYDLKGNLYAGGITTGPYIQIPNGKYPTTVGAFSQSYNGGMDDNINDDYWFPCDITISKYSPDGKNLMYATYLGGSNNEYPHSLVVDKEENLIILGSTFSLNYPISDNAYQKLNYGKADIIITKLTQDGDSLVGSTYYGGSQNDGLNESVNTKYFYADNFRGDIIYDDDGSLIGVISTKSNDIFIKDGFKKNIPNNVQQGLIFKFSKDMSELKWSSYIGSNNNTSIYSVDFDKNKDIFVSGGIADNGLQNTVGTLYSNYRGGKADGYIAKISKDGKSILKATYFGSDKYDQIISLELDEYDRVYVVGQTEGIIPVKGNVYNNGDVGQFLTVLNHDLTNVIYSATFGTGDGRPDITINAFMVAECNRVFISGWGGVTTWASGVPWSSTKNLPITNDAIQKTTDGSDFYIIVFAKELKKLLYATYFGGNKTNDHVDGGTSRFDKKGVIYQSVCSSCPMGNGQVGPISDFPTSIGVFAEKNLSPRCSNAAFKFALENLNLKPELRDTFFKITVFDTLNFDYSIYDPDDDTLNSSYTTSNNIEKDFLSFPNNVQGVSKITSKFFWIPQCRHASSDTLIINANVKDRGCPDYKTNSAKIKILVLPPSVLPPPNTICLVFKENDKIEISWSSIQSSKYYGYTVLYKIFPNGKTVAIDTIKSTGEGIYLDTDVKFPRTQNYSYFLKVVNKCNAGGELSYKVSSVQENESPITPTTIITATVKNNKDVSVHWLKSIEPDFGSYSVYKCSNKDSLNFEYLTDINNINDTFFIDNKVNVQSESFCYSIVVNDRCGMSSKKSNIGCNIVLSGVSKPFYHTLNWQIYRKWNAGVASYSLMRSVDTGSLSTIVALPNNFLNYDDHSLDYDWGGYWYSIVANENSKGYNAQSQSNSIYLIQPPLLHVPNVFTKNDDNLNETWGFVPVFVKTYHMQVFNRWGEKVFDSENKKEDWDGNYLEKTKGTEVFIWQVTYTGWDRSTHYQKGTVTVLR